MKTEVLVESFYITIELTDPFPYMTPVSGLILPCPQPAQGVLFSGKTGLDTDS